MKTIPMRVEVLSKTFCTEGDGPRLATVSMSSVDDGTYELFLAHSGQVPVRYRGRLALMISTYNAWKDARLAEGFVERPNGWNPYESFHQQVARGEKEER